MIRFKNDHDERSADGIFSLVSCFGFPEMEILKTFRIPVINCNISDLSKRNKISVLIVIEKLSL